MKIKVGYYIRTSDGMIDKIKELGKPYLVFDKDKAIWKQNDIIITERYDRHIYKSFMKKCGDVVKKNLIDLLKEGDYVNGHYIYKSSNNTFYYFEKNQETRIIQSDEDIQDIVTKEEFNRRRYVCLEV